MCQEDGRNRLFDILVLLLGFSLIPPLLIMSDVHGCCHLRISYLCSLSVPGSTFLESGCPALHQAPPDCVEHWLSAMSCSGGSISQSSIWLHFKRKHRERMSLHAIAYAGTSPACEAQIDNNLILKIKNCTTCK